ncbi:TPM domain-containing protein [Pseudomonas sp. EL_65y_Pfl2_R95]|uniref:TPM domain-containing protein n=1 Tax=Pseudomonas sp. EL_65y_Pfl2_R95 TaxID=3088698 RepID=UPI0030DBCEFB
MTVIKRVFTNLFSGWFQLGRSFPAPVLDEIGKAIGSGEAQHIGEVRFAIEARMHIIDVLAGMTSRARAEQVFAEQGVWDTEHNSGILIYLLLAEKRVEIVADRGIARHVDQAQWDAVCSRMCEHFAQGLWRQGSLEAIDQAHGLLRQFFADPRLGNPNELPDQPIIL